MDYEKAVEDFYTSILRPGDFVVDCGAHVGRHTEPMQRLVGAAGHVFAFEPLPKAFSALKSKFRAVENVTLHNCALGVEAGTSSFVFVPDFPEYSGFQERIYHDDKLRRETITVEVKRLDQIMPNEGIRYIKVDAEGGDLLIMRGAEGIIEKSRPYVTFELGDNSLINYNYSAQDYFDFFASKGYRLSTILGIELDRNAFVESSATQKVWDYIAAPDHAG